MSPDGPATFPSPLPPALAPIGRLALNLRWVWNHATDRLWEALNAEVWHQTRNPILVLQNTPRSRLDELARDAEFVERVRRLDRSEAEYLSRPELVPGQTCSMDPPPRDRLLQHGVRPHATRCRSTRAASACSPATTSRPRATSACRWSRSACSTARATSGRCSTPRARRSRSTRSTPASRCRCSR